MDVGSITLILIPTGTLIVAIVTAIIGIRAYRQGQKLKRKEILFSLTEELDKSEPMEHARLILDDGVIRYNRNLENIDTYDIIWEEIQGDYQPLKDLLKDEMGMDWVEDSHFIRDDKKDVVNISDQDSFLSIIPNHRLPYRVDEKKLDTMINLEDNKSNYKHVYYFYTNIVHKKVVGLGCYYHRSNLKHILRKQSERLIMDSGEDEIRRSFDSVFRFLERLGYIDRNLGLTDEEVGFFKTFVMKMKDVEGIDEYIESYKFNLEKLHP